MMKIIFFGIFLFVVFILKKLLDNLKIEVIVVVI